MPLCYVEPEVYVILLVTSRSHAGSDGELVAHYRRRGFEPTEPCTVGTRPGQVLAQRVAARNRTSSD